MGALASHSQNMKTRLILAIVLAASGCSSAPRKGEIPVYFYEVVHTYPHDPKAFTEGLFYLNGYLYESTGLVGESSVRKVKLETGAVEQIHTVPEPYFGEGIVNWKDRLFQLTYQTQTGFVYDFGSFNVLKEFKYPGEGWAMTHDGNRIIMSDGTAELRFWDPESLGEISRITVTADGEPVKNVNELEWVKGEVYANVWQTDLIARIDPKTGAVLGWINLVGLWPGSDNREKTLNGIAYDAEHDRLFVTGKEWPNVFEIRLKK
jgi:glutaminyl-peptide cyclotransferase